MSPRRTIMASLVLALTVAVQLFGCRHRAQPRPAGNEDSAGLTPSQAIMKLHETRVGGKLGLLDQYLPAGEAGLHLSVILAMDEVLARSAALQVAATRRFGAALAQGLDLSGMGDAYGVFSRSVRVIREEVKGDQATVVIQEGDHVPLIDVALTRTHGRWLVAMARPEPGLAGRLQKLAQALEKVRAQVEREKSTFGDIETAFRYSIVPLLKSIDAADR